MKQKCEQCGKQLNPTKDSIDTALGGLCGECALKSNQCFTLCRKRLPSGQIIYQALEEALIPDTPGKRL